MKNRNHRLYINDILESISKIEEYTKDLPFEKFSKDRMVIDAVTRNFEIIGEASKNIPDGLKLLHNDVPWKEMAGMRDKVIHAYFGVDLEIVWRTIKERLPELKKILKQMAQSV